MNREEAIELAINEHDCKYSEELINRIYHNFEVQLNTKDERIKELEEAIKPKTCDGCVHEVGDMQDPYCAFCSRSCDDNFEPKEQ